MTPSISVVIPSYGRAGRLAACLDGLRTQLRQPTEVVVVARGTDAETVALVSDRRRSWRELRLSFVGSPGLVAALNHGIRSASGDVVAFVDDDAVPHRDWLERIASVYELDLRIAAVGGKDIVHHGERIDDSQDGRFLARWRPRRAPPVGRLQWFGRMTSNHNAGAGGLRDVHVLKGANMSYRRLIVAELGGFDERLRGTGSQVHNEATICLPLLRKGLRVVYDPRILVDHYPTERPGGDRRESTDSKTIRDATHNYVLALLDHLPPARRCCFLVWMVGVGTGSTPGLVNAVRLRLSRRPEAWRRMRAAQCGVLLAIRTWREVPRVPARLGCSEAGREAS
jgi:GT2 family glycosyltransferase